MSGQEFKKFVSEEEVAQHRKQRQADWERVRKEDDPEECPEEESRSLFEQLQANKDVQDKEYSDESKLRSSVKGLDDEEVQFLNYVSTRQMQLEKERSNEEKSVIKEMKAAKVIKVDDKVKDQKTTEKATPSASASSSSSSTSSGGKKSQLQLLSGAIKRKSMETESDEPAKKKNTGSEKVNTTEVPTTRPDAKLMEGLPKSNGVAVVAGVLPGISRYDDDDSSTENSSNSSDSEADHMVYPSSITQRVIQEMVKKLKSDCG